MARFMAMTDTSSQKHLPLFKALLDEGAELELFKMVKESLHENFVHALYEKRPEQFSTEGGYCAQVLKPTTKPC